MKKITLKNSTVYENGVVTALIGVENARVQDCTVAKLDNGDVVAWAPQERYEKDGNVTYKKVVTWNGEAMNAAAAALVANPTEDLHLYAEPFAVNGGSKIGVATLVGDCTVKVTVLTKEDGSKTLVLPGRKYTSKDGKTRTAYFVWPFETSGDELKAEIDALVAEIVANAKPYEPKEQ
jgi:hypothetical protein